MSDNLRSSSLHTDCGRMSVQPRSLPPREDALSAAHVIGIDIGGTHFRIGAVREDCQVDAFRKVSVKEIFHSPDPLRDLRDYLADYMRQEKLTGKDTAPVFCAG